MSFQSLGDITNRIVERIAPVEYKVPVNGALAQRLESVAKRQHVRAETIIAEALRVYIGDAA